MNAKQRELLMKLQGDIEAVKSQVDFILSDEEEKFDNLPEGFQAGERGEKMQSGIDLLNDVTNSLEETIDYFTQIFEL
jgi:hypothetical protein